MKDVEWTEFISREEWRRIVAVLELSPGQEQFLWHALHDPRENIIAARMGLTPYGAHAHRMAVFRKLQVDCMPAAIARVFAAYITTHHAGGRLPRLA